MALTRVEISQLFGLIDHQLVINQDNGITIFTAPNGYGKTLLLRLIDACYRGDFPTILSVDFKLLTFYFDQARIEFAPLSNTQLSICLFELSQTNAISEQVFDLNNFSNKLSISELEETCHRIDFSAEGSMDIWGNNEFAHQCHEATVNQHPEAVIWRKQLYDHKIKQLLKNSETKLINTERTLPFKETQKDLFNCTDDNPISALEKCAVDLAAQFSAHKSNYQQTAAELDGTLANRLLEAETCQLSEDILTKQYKKLYDFRLQLESVKLLERQRPPLPQPSVLMKGDQKLVNLIIQDLRTKLSLFQSLMTKVNLFLELVNKNLSFKSLSLCPDKGFTVIADNKTPLELNLLSSGEQQLIILCFEVAMSLQDKLTLLIDEPEAGISSQWQQNLIEQFMQICERFNLNMIIATGSRHILEDLDGKLKDSLIIKRCDGCGQLH